MFQPLTPLGSLAATEEWGLIFAFVFMGFDVLVGTVCAFATNSFKSSVMREGLGHKAMITLVILLAVVVQLAGGVIGDLGFEIPVILPVCVAVILMELGSCLEIIGSAYPGLSDIGIFKYFTKE